MLSTQIPFRTISHRPPTGRQRRRNKKELEIEQYYVLLKATTIYIQIYIPLASSISKYIFFFVPYIQIYIPFASSISKYIIRLHLCLDLLGHYCHFGDSDTDLRGWGVGLILVLKLEDKDIYKERKTQVKYVCLQHLNVLLLRTPRTPQPAA